MVQNASLPDRLEAVCAGIQPLEEVLPGSYTLQTDGASKGNPGPAGLGMVFQDPSGREAGRYRLYIGEATNNTAEYAALISGLILARSLGLVRLTVRLDSELAVFQLKGNYRVGAGLKPLHDKALALLKSLESYRLTHVPREENQAADRLASQAAVDGRSGLLPSWQLTQPEVRPDPRTSPAAAGRKRKQPLLPAAKLPEGPLPEPAAKFSEGPLPEPAAKLPEGLWPEPAAVRPLDRLYSSAGGRPLDWPPRREDSPAPEEIQAPAGGVRPPDSEGSLSESRAVRPGQSVLVRPADRISVRDGSRPQMRPSRPEEFLSPDDHRDWPAGSAPAGPKEPFLVQPADRKSGRDGSRPQLRPAAIPAG
ncbi:MAG: reverse transcriptase-like protein, partial [Deltaproteobacteria bacterium]|nr:reverse transcriptase-like protein [Deltaproteobacteria bacterium]